MSKIEDENENLGKRMCEIACMVQI